MSHFSEMVEWNTKWDWENIVSFGPKPTAESPKKKQQLLTEWMIVDDGEINPQQFDLSRSGGDGGGGGGNNSGSDDDGGDGHNSSARSSISASTDSSTKDGGINFRYHYGNLSEKIKGSEFSLVETSSVGSGEPLIGLKLGKRTYFENTIKSTQPFPPLPAVLKKTNKSSKDQNCQVDGCNTDLSQAKEYHRKHRVCDGHSKYPKVIIRGLERRFCQQCSRFHSLCEFDEKKRSCRRRLSDHNARRRKPQQETIRFNSSTRRVSSPYYGGNQHLLLNNCSPIRSTPHPPANSIWDGASNSKFTLTEGYPLRSNGGRDTDDGQLHDVPGGIKPPRAINVQNGVNGLWEASNNSAASSEVFDPEPKGSLISSLDTAPLRALSLLSSNSWDSCEPDSIPSHTALHENFTHPTIHPIPKGVPLSSSEFWLSGQQLMHPRIQSVSNFQGSQVFKTTYDEADFYSNILS